MSQNNSNNNIKGYLDLFNIIINNLKTINNIITQLQQAIGKVDIEIPDQYTIILKGEKVRIVIESTDPKLMPIFMDVIDIIKHLRKA